MNITVAGVDKSRSYGPDEFDAISIELAAFDAEIGGSSVPIPDPEGTDDVAAGRNVLITDGTVAGTPPTFTTFLDGFIGGQVRTRGTAPAPPGRLTTYSVQDANVLLYGMIVEKWARPAETDVERVLAAAAAFWPTLDTTWVLGEIAGTPPRNSPVDLPAKTYDTIGFVGELVTDLVDATGKTLFVRAADGVRYLHYHALTEGPTAAFSLDATDGVADYETIFPFKDPSHDSDGLDLVYRVIARGPDGLSVTVEDTDSEDAHHADGRSFEAITDFPEAADLVELTALADRFLDQNKDERETFKLERIGPLTAVQAAGIGPGFLIEVTNDVLGLTAATKRIAHLTWHYEHPGIWFADLELAMPLRFPKPAKKPGLSPCTETTGTPIVGTVETQSYYAIRGTWFSPYGFFNDLPEFALTIGKPGSVGWQWFNMTLTAGIGYNCPAGTYFVDPIELHTVCRFDTSSAVRSDCTTGAELSFVLPNYDCACGPYELVSGAYWAAAVGDLTVGRFRQGKVVTTVDLSHESTIDSPTVVSIPPEHVNYGGYTVLALRPRWRVKVGIACNTPTPAFHCNPTDSDGGIVHYVAFPWHYIFPGNVHRAILDENEDMTLSGLTLSGAACLTSWMTAVCAETIDDAAVPADNCADECCTIWWRTCATYRAGTLEVSVGGHVLRRGADFWERPNRKVFRLRVGSCDPPKVRFMVG